MASNTYEYNEIIQYVVLDEAVEGLRSQNGQIIQALQNQGFEPDLSRKLVKSLIKVFSSVKSEMLFSFAAHMSDKIFSFPALLGVTQSCLEHYPEKKAALKLLLTLIGTFNSAKTLAPVKGEYQGIGGDVRNIDELNKFTASISSILQNICQERERLFYLKLLEGHKITAHGRDVTMKSLQRNKIVPTKWKDLRFKEPDKAVFSSTVIYDGLQFSLNKIEKRKGRESRIPNAKAVIIAKMRDRFASNSHCKKRRHEAKALQALFPQYTLASIERYINTDYQELLKSAQK